MRTEYICLVSLAAFFLLAWVPASLGKFKTYGAKWAMSNRSGHPEVELPKWVARCERAHNNLKDNLPAFMVAILVLGALNKFDNSTAIASVIYVVARCTHFLVYGLGNVPLRGMAFFTGFLVNFYLLIKVLI